ncbi:hypothetical protein [Selenomonas noxia]|uniref:hypothetical protein n=1 Tax=Selenomonas noxia TaxID=135083 RepID=UPI0028E382A3|nr:hypothetical protein [Selenomonas noxia]
MASLKQMEKRWENLRRKQEALQQEMKKTKRNMEMQRTNDIGRIIRRTGFPVHNMAILVGALVHAKERIDAGDRQAMDQYISCYTRFQADHPDAGLDDFMEEAAVQQEETTEAGSDEGGEESNGE